jgi:hypothetical protein
MTNDLRAIPGIRDPSATVEPDPLAEPIRLVLVALPDPVPARVRVRRALKLLLRAYGLRCIRLEAADPWSAFGQPSCN